MDWAVEAGRNLHGDKAFPQDPVLAEAEQHRQSTKSKNRSTRRHQETPLPNSLQLKKLVLDQGGIKAHLKGLAWEPFPE